MGKPFSTRPVTTSKDGIRVICQSPNGSGWITKQIPVENLLAGVGNTPIGLVNMTGDFNVQFDNNSHISQIYLFINSGTPTIQIGRTHMGTEVLESTLLTGDLPVPCFERFSTSGKLYFYVSGGNVDIRIDFTPNFRPS